MKWVPIKPPFAYYKRTVLTKAAKVAGFIYQIGEYEGLRKSSKEVPVGKIKSYEMRKKLKYLKACLRKYRKLTGYGRGITAVQAGIPERFSVIYTPKALLTIINPKVTKKSLKLLKYPEICMSANPIIAPTIRPSWIELEYYDENGKLQYWNKKDNTKRGKMLNRVFQHEIDHMEGIINIDRVKSPKDLILECDPNFYKNAEFEEI